MEAQGRPPSLNRKKHANDRVPLHILSREKGIAGLSDLLMGEMSRTDWSDESKEMISRAGDLSIRVHSGQLRDDGQEYSTHAFRNALRYITPERLCIRDQPEIVAAILLHDTVEDNPWELLGITKDSISREEAQEQALEKIWDEFSPNVAVAVALFTIPPYPREDMTPEEKRRHHYDNRKMILELDSPIGAAILTDIIDNGMANEHEVDEGRRDKQMLKYIPELPLYKAYVSRNRHLFTKDALGYIKEVFSNVEREHAIWRSRKATPKAC